VKGSYVEGLVSTIVPVFNAERWVEKSVRSALAQTYENLEVVAVDDGSTDQSTEILKRLALRFPRVRYYRLEENAGVTVARNKALSVARGQYIAFLDSDDIWHPRKIELQLSAMMSSGNALSYTAIEMIDEDDRMIKRVPLTKALADYGLLLRNTIMATSSVVVDRKLTGDFSTSDDYATWLALMREGHTASGVADTLVKYRRRKNSLSSRKLANCVRVWRIQRHQEKIGWLSALGNTLQYGINAFVKHVL
jgi:teichuronic acid biosynthesis glycosyltransferase TuaG